ncbi:phosphoribosyl-ATP diphosphatase [Denitrobacterium detoxificans]|jgi:phosphoribosyl-ATP pyrophosphohydrolase/phosphoribosyl-ATP pyrophosphohydrolase/phosphoribosyl-AMP cyclohydrolase|uniref:phosphoribosyl-ATP diphosphatase n=1 Tax=Denitrobacterium detoxificans TaxID=79604 RepID=UPI0026EE27F9|nr:phosphoribosyl-ATP diphosphatase [Denitrobacterium detoxificans]MBE6465686.1 phosphoribosyl-ATP diphosphatase [Denitrobacterium detoxificans]
MSSKTYVPEGEVAPASQIGATIEALAATIADRRHAGEESYTHGLLTGKDDDVLKKVMEESGEVALAAKDVARASQEQRDAEVDHLRYEAADVVYHLLVVLERYGIDLDEFAAELNMRMREDERPAGAVRLQPEHVKRGK